VFKVRFWQYFDTMMEWPDPNLILVTGVGKWMKHWGKIMRKENV